jgi:hypothetical protein
VCASKKTVFGDEYDPEKNNEKEGLKSRDFHFTPKKKKKKKPLVLQGEKNYGFHTNFLVGILFFLPYYKFMIIQLILF